MCVLCCVVSLQLRLECQGNPHNPLPPPSFPILAHSSSPEGLARYSTDVCRMTPLCLTGLSPAASVFVGTAVAFPRRRPIPPWIPTHPPTRHRILPSSRTTPSVFSEPSRSARPRWTPS